MKRETLSDLVAFATVAREGSFTRAAAALGMSQSGLSHLIRGLESRIGLRLLARTTRSVAPTEAGARLLATLEPRLRDISDELEALGSLRDRPSGTIRISAGDTAVASILMPKLPAFLRAWPEVTVDISVDYGLIDIVAQRFDAGIRMGEQVAKDMIAVPVGPDLRMACVASPGYLAGRPRPMLPQALTEHACINLRLQTQGALYAWEFAKDGRELRVKVDGPLIFNQVPQILEAARLGLGIAFVPEDRAEADLRDGRLERLLADWCPRFPGYHLYYPSRRQPSAAFAKLIEALRWKPARGSAEDVA